MTVTGESCKPAVKRSRYSDCGFSIIRSVNVATPSTVCTIVVPCSFEHPGLLKMAAVTGWMTSMQPAYPVQN